MAHTLLCGQRRYTMPAVILPQGRSFVDTSLQFGTAVALKITNIRPPGGIIISARQYITASGIPTSMRVTFVTEQGNVVVSVGQEPTLFVSDGMILSATYSPTANSTLDFFQYWLVPDVAYFTEVRNAYSQ